MPTYLWLGRPESIAGIGQSSVAVTKKADLRLWQHLYSKNDRSCNSGLQSISCEPHISGLKISSSVFPQTCKGSESQQAGLGYLI